MIWSMIFQISQISKWNTYRNLHESAIVDFRISVQWHNRNWVVFYKNRSLYRRDWHQSVLRIWKYFESKQWLTKLTSKSFSLSLSLSKEIVLRSWKDDKWFEKLQISRGKRSIRVKNMLAPPRRLAESLKSKNRFSLAFGDTFTFK